jgi:hypothetical protein
MTQRKKAINPDNPLKELTKLLRKLDPDQGMVARRNARAAVTAELRRVRAFVDKTYPVLTQKKPRRKRKTGQAKVDELQKRGWVAVLNEDALNVADAGITVKVIQDGQRRWVLVPRWADEIMSNPRWTTAMLSKAARSVTYRKEVIMEFRLKNPHLKLVTG